MGKLNEITNIGKKLEEQLNNVGINDINQLKLSGSKKAWSMIKGIDESAWLNRLYALEGAIKNIRWHDLDDDTKRNLKEFKINYGK